MLDFKVNFKPGFDTKPLINLEILNAIQRLICKHLQKNRTFRTFFSHYRCDNLEIEIRKFQFPESFIPVTEHRSPCPLPSDCSTSSYDTSDSTSSCDTFDSQSLAELAPNGAPNGAQLLSAWNAICLVYDDVVKRQWPRKPSNDPLRSVARMSARNVLEKNPGAPRNQRPFSLRRASNIKAVLMQVSGELQPAGRECQSCRKGRGLWAGCVTAAGTVAPNLLQGSCANCFYNGGAGKCGFYTRRGM